MTNETNYYIERLSAERLPDLAKLYRSVYGRSAAKVFFAKKYATAYTGKQYIGFIAYATNGEPVGYYGVIPCMVLYAGQRMLAAQSADTMTHPQYRFKGLFVTLANLCYDLCRNEGITLVFGFPNQHSYHGAVQKLGWQLTDTMDCFIIPVKTIAAEKIMNRLSLLRPIYHRYARFLLKKQCLPAKQVPDNFPAEGFNGVCRDEAYMRYKTYQENWLLRAGEAIVWVKIQNGLLIGDMKLGQDDFDDTIRAVKRLAIKLGLTQLQFHISPGTEVHRLFIGKYDAMPSFPVLFRDLGFNRPLDAFKFSSADIDIF